MHSVKYDPYLNHRDPRPSKSKPIEVMCDADNYIIGIKNSPIYRNFYRGCRRGQAEKTPIIRFEKHIADSKVWHVIINIVEGKVLLYNKERPIKIGAGDEQPLVFRIDADFNISYDQADQHLASMIILRPEDFSEVIESVRLQNPAYAEEKGAYDHALTVRNNKKTNASRRAYDNIMWAAYDPVNSFNSIKNDVALKLKTTLFNRERNLAIESAEKNTPTSSAATMSAVTVKHSRLIEECLTLEEYAHAQKDSVVEQLQYYNVQALSPEYVKKSKDYARQCLTELRSAFALFQILKNKNCKLF